jgi:2-dehydropantoate 2-reductase
MLESGIVTMKIAVIGAGAIGSIIGGLLCKAGEDITLVGRKAHVDAINRNGLILDAPDERAVIRVKAAENLDFKPDLALLTAKTQDVESSVRKAQSFLSRALIVTTQNGVQSDDIVAGILGKENIISGVVLYNCEFLETLDQDSASHRRALWCQGKPITKSLSIVQQSLTHGHK